MNLYLVLYSSVTNGISILSIQYPATGIAGRPQAGGVAGTLTNEPGESGSYDPLIGRKVWTKWPEDNNFYEAVITDFNQVEVSFIAITWCFSTKTPSSDIDFLFKH